MLSKFSILYEIYQALEISQFEISKNSPELENEFRNIFYITNAERLAKNKVLSEEFQLVQISLIFSISERLRIIYSKNMSDSVYAFYQSVSNILDILQKQLFCEHSDENIFKEIMRSILIPAFINLLEKTDLEIIKNLIPSENETFADKFIALTGITKSIENSPLFQFFSPDDFDSDTQERKKLQENFRVAKQNNKLPTSPYIHKIYKNSPIILRIFTYSKLLNYFSKLDISILDFTKKLIEDKLNGVENKILYQNEGDIINSIFINLALAKNIFFANLNSLEANDFLQNSYQREETCRILNKLQVSLKDKKIDVSKIRKASKSYKYNGISIIRKYKELKKNLLLEKENDEIDEVVENMLLNLREKNYTSIKYLLKQYLKRLKK